MLLLKLEAAEKSSKLASIAVTGMIIGTFSVIVLLLLSALGCYLLQKLTGSWEYGFGIVILFYIVVIAVLIAFRKSFFHKHIANFVIRLFFEKNEDDELEN